jgi:MFS family permease
MPNQLSSLSSLFVGTAILLLGHGLQLSLLPLRAESLGWTSMSIGWSSSIYFGGFVVGCFSVPGLVKGVGHIRVFTVLTAAMTTALLGISLTDSLPAWLALRALTGWSIAGLYLVIESWLNEQVSNEGRGSLLSVYTMTALISMATGQLLLNMAEPSSYQIVAIAASCVALAAVPVGLTRVPQPSPIPSARFSPLLVLRTSRTASVSSFVAGTVTGCFYGLGPLYGRQMGLEVGAISVMMAGGIIGGAIFQWPLGRISDSVDRRAVICTAMLTGVVVCGLTTVIPVDWLPHLIFVLGAAVMPIYALALAHAGDNVETSFLEVGTGILIVNAVGATIGPIVAASAMTAWGPQFFFIFSGAILALGATVTLLLIRASPPVRPHFSPFEVATTVAAQGAIELDPRSDDEEADSTILEENQ